MPSEIILCPFPNTTYDFGQLAQCPDPGLAQFVNVFQDMRNLRVAHVIQSDMRRLDISNAYSPEASHGSGLDARFCVFKHSCRDTPRN